MEKTSYIEDTLEKIIGDRYYSIVGDRNTPVPGHGQIICLIIRQRSIPVDHLREWILRLGDECLLDFLRD